MAEAGDGLGFGGSNKAEGDHAHAFDQELKGNETAALLYKVNNGGQDAETLAAAARGNLAAELALKQFKGKRATAAVRPERGTGTPGHFKAVVPPPSKEIQVH